MYIAKRSTDCPNGGLFYSCSNGFRGCCLVDPCMPNSGCPKEEDRTPNSSQSISTTSSTVRTAVSVTQTNTATSTVRSSQVSDPASTSSKPASRTGITATLTAPSPLETVISVPEGRTTHGTKSHGTSEASGPSAIVPGRNTQAQNDSSVPLAAIIGPIIGAIVLTTAIICVFFFFRRRERTRTYRAATFSSPYIGGDMSGQLPSIGNAQFKEEKSLYGGFSRVRQSHPHQLDSKEIVPKAELGEAPARHIAELPANFFTAIHPLQTETPMPKQGLVQREQGILF